MSELIHRRWRMLKEIVAHWYEKHNDDAKSAYASVLNLMGEHEQGELQARPVPAVSEPSVPCKVLKDFHVRARQWLVDANPGFEDDEWMHSGEAVLEKLNAIIAIHEGNQP
jgi:hypothetical protein